MMVILLCLLCVCVCVCLSLPLSLSLGLVVNVTDQVTHIFYYLQDVIFNLKVLALLFVLV